MSPLIFSDSFIFENWISKSRSLEKECSSLEAVIDKYFFYSTKISKIQNRFIEKKISHAVVFFPQCTAKVWILKKRYDSFSYICIVSEYFNSFL